jgi:NAD(P)-dependent dehydrogenase (short-subunit alcohol dehydrogenase family)
VDSLRRDQGRDRHDDHRAAKEVAAEGIRVNAVRPGIIDTDIHRIGPPGRSSRCASRSRWVRLGTVDEIAHIILWLASDEASYVTAALLDARGGI